MDLMVGGARQRLERDRAIGAHHAGGALFEHDVALRGFEQDARHHLELGAHLLRRQQGGAAGDNERATGECPPAIWRAVRVAMDNADAVG